MKIQRSTLEEGVAGLAFTGEFDSFAANPFLEQVEACIQSGAMKVVVNLRLVLFINSTAIGSLIKARKRVRSIGGDLVVATPSDRVKNALDALGLSQVIKSFDSEEEAVDHLLDKEDAAVDVPSDNAVLLKFAASDKQAAYTKLGHIAKMASLEDDGIHFKTKGGPDLFENGTELRVKFRLPLFRRAYYFDLLCSVGNSESTDDGGMKVFAQFRDIVEDDQRSISQFVRDLRLLKEEIRSAGSD